MNTKSETKAESGGIREALDAHFVMWHALPPGPRAVARPTGEWRCTCGFKCGFSQTAIDHVAEMVEASLSGTRYVEFGVRFCGEAQAKEFFGSEEEAQECVDHIRKMIREDEYDPDDYEPIEIVRRVRTTRPDHLTDWERLVSLPTEVRSGV